MFFQVLMASVLEFSIIGFCVGIAISEVTGYHLKSVTKFYLIVAWCLFGSFAISCIIGSLTVYMLDPVLNQPWSLVLLVSFLKVIAVEFISLFPPLVIAVVLGFRTRHYIAKFVSR